MKLLKNVFIVLLFFIHSFAFSMNHIEREIEQAKLDLSNIIAQCHVLFKSSQNITSLLSSQDYNICAVAIITPDGKRMNLVLVNNTSQNLQIPEALLEICYKHDLLETDIAIFKNGGSSGINIAVANMAQENCTSLDQSDLYFSGIYKGSQQMRAQNSSGLTLEDGVARHTDAEERALYAIQQLMVNGKIPDGSTIVLVSLMDTCKFCACSAAGFAKRYNKFFKEIKIYYLVDYSCRCEKDLKELGVTREIIPQFHTESCMLIAAQKKKNKDLVKNLSIKLDKSEFANWFVKEGFKNPIVLYNDKLKKILATQLRSLNFTKISQEFATWFVDHCIAKYPEHRDITESLFNNPSFIKALLEVTKQFSQFPPEFVYWLINEGYTNSELFAVQSFFNSICEVLKKMQKPQQMHPRFASIFVEHIELLTENYKPLLSNPEFVIRLCEALKCSKSLKIGKNFASLFINWIMEAKYSKAVVELLDVPLFVDEINKLEKIDIQPDALAKFISNDEFRDSRASLLQLKPFVICVIDCFSKTLNINQLIPFIQWSLQNGLPMSVSPLFSVTQFTDTLVQIFNKNQSLKMHPNFACAFIVSCQKQAHYGKLFHITKFIDALRSSLTESKSAILQISPQFANWFISWVISDKRIKDNRIAAIKLLEVPVFINSLNKITVAFEEQLFQRFIVDNQFRESHKAALNLLQFVNLLSTEINKDKYDIYHNDFAKWCLQSGLPISAFKLVSAPKFINALINIVDEEASSETMSSSFACAFIVGCEEQNMEQWKQLFKKQEFVNALCVALEKSKTAILQMSPQFVEWLISLIIDDKKDGTEACKEVISLLDIPLFSRSFNTVLYVSKDKSISNINDFLKFMILTEKLSQQLLQLRSALLHKILIEFKATWEVSENFISWFMENANESIINTAFSNANFANKFYGFFKEIKEESQEKVSAKPIKQKSLSSKQISFNIEIPHNFAYQFIQYYYSLPKKQQLFDLDKASLPFVVALKKTLKKDELEKAKTEALKRKESEISQKQQSIKTIFLSPLIIAKSLKLPVSVTKNQHIQLNATTNIEEIFMPGDGDCGYHALNINCSTPQTQSNSRELLIIQLLSSLSGSQALQVRQLIAQEITDRIIAGDLDELIFNLLDTNNYQLGADILNAMSLGNQANLDVLTQNAVIVELYLNMTILWGRMRYPDGWLQFATQHNEVTRTGIGDAIAFLLGRNLIVIEGRNGRNIGTILHEYRCPNATETIYLIQATDNHYNRGKIV